MSKYSVMIAIAVTSVFAGVADPAWAQASRTWVSGVGDDVNPCSRTAPCKTFAGAISKTAAGGEINCLDPGGFGAVTIVKAMTINCLYTEGGVLAGGNGVVVNAGASDVVVLRGLDIFGVNPPTHGIRFIAGAALHVQNCTIKRFNAANSMGISFAPSGASELYVTDTSISENGNGITGGGITITPTGTGSAKAVLTRVQVDNNAAGIIIGTGVSTGQIRVVVTDSSTSGNATHGILAQSGGGSVRVLLDHVTSANNVDHGIRSVNGNTLIRMANSNIHANAVGTAGVSSGAINSFGNNRIEGNTDDGVALTIIDQK